jgi:hypothetical protein
MSQEVEDSLIICSNDPQNTSQEIARQISAWKFVNNKYLLIPQTGKKLHDLYFDTPNQNLQARRISVRVRDTSSAQTITVKIPSSQNTTKMTRFDNEIERPWSEDGLLFIVRVLRDNKIKLTCTDQNLDVNRDVRDVMRNLGLEVIQDRYTQREIRSIVKNNNMNQVLAELDIDSVVYMINYNKIRHYQIEVEEKYNNQPDARIAITTGLLSSFRPFLRRWRYGKLTIGKGIKRLIDSNDLTEEEYSNLKWFTYDKLEELILARII